MLLGRSIVLYNAAFKAIILALIALNVLSITDAATDALVLAVSTVLDLFSANNVTSTGKTTLAPQSEAKRHAAALDHIAQS